MLFLFAHVGVDRFAVGGRPGQFGVHAASAPAPEQAGEQRLIAAGLAVALGLVSLQRFLHPHPDPAGDQARMLPHRHNPFAGGQVEGGPALFLVGAVVGQDAPFPVKIPGGGTQSGLLVHKIPVGVRVGQEIHGVLQNPLDGKPGEVSPGFGVDLPAQQLRLGHGEGVGLAVQLIDGADNVRLLGDQFQFAGPLGLAVHRHRLDRLGSVAGGGGASQPAAGFGQLLHIVPDALGDGLPFQLAEHRRNVHHGPAHGAGGVEALPDGDKVDLQPAQLLDEGGKVADAAADPVQPVDHHRPELPLPGGLHHFLEAGAVQVAAREALVLKDRRPVGAEVPEGSADIGPAKLHLVPDAFPLAGEAGFPGIDGDDVGIWLFLHGGTPFTGCYMRGRDIP